MDVRWESAAVKRLQTLGISHWCGKTLSNVTGKMLTAETGHMDGLATLEESDSACSATPATK
ncbi:hypothetical protein RIEGSTA812A_PEG_341 [invertebrate metagenome]|uniref:Uncharacterized protein n=1 Tax=invertebrate metagenome TaxID=1711999 RepID=A0A484H9M9_9ZZZZ